MYFFQCYVQVALHVPFICHHIDISFRWAHVSKHTHHLGFLVNLSLFFKLILDLSWVQQSSSPSTYYQSASSLTFREEEDKKGGERDRGGETAISAFHVKQQWIMEAGLAFLRNTDSVIRPVITVLIILAPHWASGSICCSDTIYFSYFSFCFFLSFWCKNTVQTYSMHTYQL